MKKIIIMSLIFVMLIGVVCAEGDWGDINDGEDSDINEVLTEENVSDEPLVDSDNVSEQDYEVEKLQFSEDSEEYTDDFYVALGFGILGLLIIALFIYLFMRGPKNKWKK